VLRWSGFGVVSFGTGNLPWTLDYIHGGATTTPRQRRDRVSDDEAGVDEAEHA